MRLRGAPPAGPQAHGTGAEEEHLVEALTGLLAGMGGDAERQVVAGVAEGISRCCQDALRTGSPDVDALRRVADEAYEAFPRTATTSAVIQCTLDYRLGLLEREGYSAARLATLDACMFEIVHALNTADTRKHVRLNAGLQASLAEEHFVSLALVGMGEREAAPRSLAWLEGTHAKTACLGLWTGDHMDEEWVSKPLRLAGLFGPGRAPAGAGDDPERGGVPPVAELTAEGCGAGDVVLVLPVRTAARYWGILAVSGKAEAGCLRRRGHLLPVDSAPGHDPR